jgi:hypothetical protein
MQGNEFIARSVSPLEESTSFNPNAEWQPYDIDTPIEKLPNLHPLVGLRLNARGGLEALSPEETVASTSHLAETVLAEEGTRVPRIYIVPYPNKKTFELKSEEHLARDDAFVITYYEGYAPIPAGRFISDDLSEGLPTESGLVVNSHDLRDEHLAFAMSSPLEMQLQLDELTLHVIEARLEDTARINKLIDAGAPFTSMHMRSLILSPNGMPYHQTDRRTADEIMLPWGHVADYGHVNALWQLESTTANKNQLVILDELLGLPNAKARDDRLEEYLAVAERVSNVVAKHTHGSPHANLTIPRDTHTSSYNITGMLTNFAAIMNMNSRYRKREGPDFTELLGENLSNQDLHDAAISYAYGVLRVAHKLAGDPLPVDA